MGVALGHLVGLGRSRRVAVVGARGRVARGDRLKNQSLGIGSQFGHGLAGRKVLRDGQLVDNRPAVVADEVDRLAGGEGEIAVERAVMGPAAGVENLALTGTELRREVILGDKALLQISGVVRQVAAAELDGALGRIENLDPASPAAVVVDHPRGIRLGQHLGNDQVGHVLRVARDGRNEQEC